VGSKTLGFILLIRDLFTDEDFSVEDILQKNQDLTPVFVDIPLKATASEVIVEVD
jgi:hypothetical protein